MGRPGFDNDNKRRVLDATDIVRLIGEHLTLKPKGREFVSLCPFHNDHNPSMYVVPAKQIFHCFVCGAGGSAIDFAMRYHGLRFREALHLLADRAGITLEFVRGSADQAPDTERRSSREEILEANAVALAFFRGLLSHSEHGAVARDAVRRRGISQDMVDAFAVGASPSIWDGLVQYIHSKGLDPAPFEDAGLIRKRPESGGHYDTFRNRLMFPILDRLGRPIAFGGRRLDEKDEPKYLNSPESRVFDKGATLFGLKQALRSIQAERTAVITEGYTDTIACHQAGFTNVVATLGTALTPKHAAALRGVCDRVILLFDSDEAGIRAADRALEVFFTEAFDLRVAELADGKDPDEVLKQEGGADRFRQGLVSASDCLEYRFARLNAQLSGRGAEVGSLSRAAAIEAEVDRLVELGLRRLPPIRQQTVIARLARLAGVNAAAVAQSLSKARGRPTPGSSDDSPPLRFRSALEHAVGCLLVEPMLAASHPEDTRAVLSEALGMASPLSLVAQAVRDSFEQHGEAPPFRDLLVLLEEGAAREAATALMAEVDRLTEAAHVRVAEHWRACLGRLYIDRERAARPTPLTPQSALERARRLHDRAGGNPLAYPRPKVGTG